MHGRPRTTGFTSQKEKALLFYDFRIIALTHRTNHEPVSIPTQQILQRLVRKLPVKNRPFALGGRRGGHFLGQEFQQVLWVTTQSSCNASKIANYGAHANHVRLKDWHLEPSFFQKLWWKLFVSTFQQFLVVSFHFGRNTPVLFPLRSLHRQFKYFNT